MPPLPVLTAREVIRVLEKIGFCFVRQRGSHKIFIKGDLMVVIPFHKKDLRPGTLKSIIKQANVSIEQLNELR